MSGIGQEVWSQEVPLITSLLGRRSLKPACFPTRPNPFKMTTIPARLATLTRTSPSAAEARKRALSLYRDWYRSVGFCVY
jgi:hypothetical protein